MVRTFLLCCFLAFGFHSLGIMAQTSEIDVPYSLTYKLGPVINFEELPSFNEEQMLLEDNETQKNGTKEYRFAKMIGVGLHPYNSGVWEETGSGKVWRLGIRSTNAYSLYLVFNEFRLMPGVKLYVYNPDYSNIGGAFTNANNNRFNKFSIAPVTGETVIVELNVPMGEDDFGKLLLSKVGHDYRNTFGKTKLKAVKGISQDCEVDINCPAGDLWQTEKRGVCKLIADGLLCTGTLINTVKEDKVPYLITAYHCVKSELIAQEAVFYFNFEKITCEGTEETEAQTLSGAELIASTNNKLDFSLLKLYEYPPLYFRPYFAGWDARPDVPQTGTCLHHPNGDVKKISVENHPLETASFGEGFDAYSHWLVNHWEIGATEGGSSGSPIFNSQHRVFGTLSGGPGDCNYPMDDYFTKLSLSWDKYSEPANQLKHWLDPDNKGVLFMNGKDPYNIELGVCDTFWNIPSNEYITLITSGLSWGALSGHNSSGFSQFAEKFLNKSTIQIPGVFLNVAEAGSANPFASIAVKIWEGDAYPTTEIYSKSVLINRLREEAVNFIGFDTLITVAGNFFMGYAVNYSDSPDTVSVYQAYNRGNNGPSTMFVYHEGSWKGIDAVSSPAVYSSLSIGIVGCNGNIVVPERTPIKFFPNPVSNTDNATVELPIGVTIDGVLCYNASGRLCNVKHQFSEGKLYIYPDNLPSGVYILKLMTKSKPLITRFSVLSKE